MLNAKDWCFISFLSIAGNLLLFNGTCVCFVTFFVGAHAYIKLIWSILIEREGYSLGSCQITRASRDARNGREAQA